MPDFNLPSDKQIFENIEAIAKEMNIAKEHHDDISWLLENVSKNDRHKHPRFQEMIFLIKVAITRKI
jgi:hypothetical protein